MTIFIAHHIDFARFKDGWISANILMSLVYGLNRAKMSVIGFVLINACAGREHEVQQVLSKIKEISERYALHYTTHSGIGYKYDFLVILSAEDSTLLDRFVETNIKNVPGIADIKIIAGMSFSPMDRYVK